jgi:hypothetical protein
MVAYACNLSYTGGWDQEDCGSRPVRPHLNRRKLGVVSYAFIPATGKCKTGQPGQKTRPSLKNN